MDLPDETEVNEKTHLLPDQTMSPRSPALHKAIIEISPDPFKGTLREKILSFCEYDTSSEIFQQPTLKYLATFYLLVNVGLIMLSTATFIAATEPRFHDYTPLWSLVIDIISVVFFTIDYLIRFICTRSKMKFVFNLFNFFDFLAFAPMYIEWLCAAYGSPVVLAYLRIFRLLRVFRLLRLVRFSRTLKVAIKSLVASTDGAILIVLIIMLNLVFFSSVMYYSESSYCYFDTKSQSLLYTFNDLPTPFQSIGATFWWNIVSITTVGYGDVVPSTTLGKFVASLALISGLILLAFPIAVFGTNFYLLYTSSKHKINERKKIRELCGYSQPKTVQDLLVLINSLSDSLEGLQKENERLFLKSKRQHEQIIRTVVRLREQVRSER
eukprot:TRINITY_DN8618_c0_g1_i5.p1 TRINITY_DN8618_c0_g1~~TRINITY_DN8618_c0_g1_i5.p1  ORF type:complete len:382 (-),score=50.86 TRINITY_DN8618_c0_g1_i5:232-1377(-)